jgi:DNA-binding MurR/RpiR family transcriptional regulator
MRQKPLDEPAGADGRSTPPSPLDELIDTAGDRLSRAELRVAQVVRNRPREAARLSISALAARSFTSDPTVVRFCHQLGFASFRQFKEFLSRDAAAAAFRLDDGADAEDALADIVCEMVRHQAWNLLQLRHRVVGNGLLPDVVARLAAAHELHFCGTGRSAAVVEHARSVFAGAGAAACAHVDPAPWPSLVDGLPGTALVIAVWDEPPPEAVQALVRAARRRQLPVLGIPAREDRLAAECDWALAVGPEASAAGATPMATLVAQSTLLDALARCAQASRQRSAPAPRRPVLRYPAPLIHPAPAQAFGA